MIKFNIFGFPVEVHWPFWIVAALLSGAATAKGPDGITFMLIGIAVIFVSILVHELGHAFAMKHFGERRAEITLHSFGGYVRGTNFRTRTEQIIISAAGPAAGGLLGLLAFMVWGPWLAEFKWLAVVVYKLMWVNIVWTIFNLLPIYPMDGGQISVAFMSKKPGGERTALIISMICAGALALWQLSIGSLFNTALLGLFAYNNYQLLNNRPQLGV